LGLFSPFEEMERMFGSLVPRGWLRPLWSEFPQQLELQMPRVDVVEAGGYFRFALTTGQVARPVAEADGRERDRGKPLEVRVRIHPPGELLGHLQVVRDPAPKPRQPEPAKHQPQLERRLRTGVYSDVPDRRRPVSVRRYSGTSEKASRGRHPPRQQQRRIER
jgi:hypothetical protein